MAINLNRNQDLWHKAKGASPAELVEALSILRERGWMPAIPAEAEWFEELVNLCAPCRPEVLSNKAEDHLREPSCAEVIRIFSPFVSAGNFFIHLYKDGTVLSHCPASSGLIEAWSTPSCQLKFQLKTFSRRSAFFLSADGSLLASYTDRNTISVNSFPEYKQVWECVHPEQHKGLSFRLAMLTEDNELVTSDELGTVHYVKIPAAPDFTDHCEPRSFKKVVPRRHGILAASKNGRYVVAPSLDLRHAVVWEFPKGEPIARIDNDGTVEITLLKAVFSPNSKYLIATGVNELQVREAPFQNRKFTIPLGLGNDLPLIALSLDSRILAVLPRSSPAQISLFSLESGERLNTLKLPSFFSRFAPAEIKFAEDGRFLYLTGNEDVYLVDISGAGFQASRLTVLELASKRIRELTQADLDSMEFLSANQWISSDLRPWIDMMNYLHQRHKFAEVELAESMEEADPLCAFDIELEDRS